MTEKQEAMSSEPARENFFERTLGSLAVAWRDLASSAARGVGMVRRDAAEADAATLRQMMRECLEARGGEVSARIRAADLGRTYLRLDAEGKHRFLHVLAHDFAVDRDKVNEAVAAWSKAGDDEARMAAELHLRQRLVPPRVRLLTQFNALPEGVKFLVDLRADLLALHDRDPWMRALDNDLFELLASWFDTGFLDLERISWSSSSAALLERLIAYEAVHEITSWDDLRNRLDSDRRCYALFHPRMPQEPLAFVEVALVEEMSGDVQALLDQKAPQTDPAKIDTAIFYSISNTQKGLRRIAFGEYLIKMVVQRLSREMPRIKTYATLSPVPGFRVWLGGRSAEEIDSELNAEEKRRLLDLAKADEPAAALTALLERPGWHADAKIAKALEAPLLRLATRYFLQRRDDGHPLDPVARFHLRNGARLERINWLGDTSPKGLRQSAGIMVNYRYVLDEIETNHEAYMAKNIIALSPEVRQMGKRLKENGSTLRRFGIG